jgi:diguanylate cyclase (GGDEF)-like protein
MNGAPFFLMVNFVVALSFSAVFIVVARRSQSRRAAILLGAGFGVASLSAICELLVAYAGPPKIWALGAFATILCGLITLSLGIGDMYRRRINIGITIGFFGVCLVLAYGIYDLPRGTLLQAFLYQSPFAIVVIAGALMVFRASQRTAIDRFLGWLLLMTGLHFFAKAGLAVLVGSGSTAADYVRSNYALISQSATAVLMVAVGLTLLAKLVLEIMEVHKTESEIDILSGLLNRRGFDRRIESLFRADPNGVHTIILCDLDHFKQINDTFGHAIGDRVIEALGAQLRVSAPSNCAVGRLGGEEFALFLPGTDMGAAVQLAQRLRLETMLLCDLPPTLKVTASFGVACVSSKLGLAEAYRRADQALYDAKNSGRNAVQWAKAM